MIVQFNLATVSSPRANQYVAEIKYVNDADDDMMIDYLAIEVEGDINAINITDTQGCRVVTISKSSSSIIVRPSHELLAKDNGNYARVALAFNAPGQYRLVPKLKAVAIDRLFYAGARTVEIKQESPQLLYLTSVEDYLGKGNPSLKEPDFFRRGGPMWVDLERGYIVERQEINHIIGRLTSSSSPIGQMISGGPATGKSTIARAVGYKLVTEKGWRAYCVDAASSLGTMSTEEVIINEINRIIKATNAPILVIVEDAHRNPKSCNLVLEKSHNLNKTNSGGAILKLLFVSRPSFKESFAKDERLYLNDAAYCEITDIDERESTRKVVSSLIELYTQRINQGAIQPTEQDKETLYERCGEGNLWVLKYFLRSWVPGQQIEEENVTAEVLSDLIDINKKYAMDNASEVIIFVAMFHSMEVLVEEHFVVGRLNIRADLISRMTANGDIIRSIERAVDRNGDIITVSILRLHHPALAKLYLETAERSHKALALRRKPTKEAITEISKEYLKTHPVNFIKALIWMISAREGILEDDEIWNYLKESLDSEMDAMVIIQCLFSLSVLSFLNGDELIEEMDLDVSHLKSLLNESDLDTIKFLPLYIGFGFDSFMKELVTSLDIPRLKAKIDGEKSLLTISLALESIAEANPSTARRIVESLDITCLKSKLDQERELAFIGGCLKVLSDVNASVAKQIIESMDVPALKHKLDEEQDLRSIGLCLRGVGKTGSPVAIQIVEHMDTDRLKEMFTRENDLLALGSFINGLGYASKNTSLKFIEDHSSKLVSMLSQKDVPPKWDRSTVISWAYKYEFLGVVAEVSVPVAQKFVESLRQLAPRIMLDPWGIADLEVHLNEIDRSCRPLADNLVENLLVPQLEAQLPGQENSWIRIIGCLSKIAKVSVSAARKLLGSLNVDKLKRILEDETSLYRMGLCLLNIGSSDKAVFLNILDSMLPNMTSKLSNQDTPTDLDALLLHIEEFDASVVTKFIESIDLKHWIKLAEQMPAEGIVSLLDQLSRASMSTAEELSSHLSPSRLKIEVLSRRDRINIVKHLRGVAKTSESLAQRIAESLGMTELIPKLKARNIK